LVVFLHEGGRSRREKVECGQGQCLGEMAFAASQTKKKKVEKEQRQKKYKKKHKGGTVQEARNLQKAGNVREVGWSNKLANE